MSVLDAHLLYKTVIEKDPRKPIQELETSKEPQKHTIMCMLLDNLKTLDN